VFHEQAMLEAITATQPLQVAEFAKRGRIERVKKETGRFGRKNCGSTHNEL